jgi:hypothetical protein
MNISSTERLISRTEQLRPEQIHCFVRIFLPRKSLLTRSRSLYLEAKNFSGTKCRLSRRNSLISQFPPQTSRAGVPTCTACSPRRSFEGGACRAGAWCEGGSTKNSGPISAARARNLPLRLCRSSRSKTSVVPSYSLPRHPRTPRHPRLTSPRFSCCLRISFSFVPLSTVFIIDLIWLGHISVAVADYQRKVAVKFESKRKKE